MTLAIQHRAVAANQVAVKLGRCFGESPLRFKVDVNDSKTLRVAGLPLEVVEKRPGEIATQIDAGINCLSRGLQMPTQVFYPLRVINALIWQQNVVESGSVFRDVERNPAVTMLHPL